MSNLTNQAEARLQAQQRAGVPPYPKGSAPQTNAPVQRARSVSNTTAPVASGIPTPISHSKTLKSPAPRAALKNRSK